MPWRLIVSGNIQSDVRLLRIRQVVANGIAYLYAVPTAMTSLAKHALNLFALLFLCMRRLFDLLETNISLSSAEVYQGSDFFHYSEGALRIPDLLGEEEVVVVVAEEEVFGMIDNWEPDPLHPACLTSVSYA